MSLKVWTEEAKDSSKELPDNEMVVAASCFGVGNCEWILQDRSGVVSIF